MRLGGSLGVPLLVVHVKPVGVPHQVHLPGDRQFPAPAPGAQGRGKTSVGEITDNAVYGRPATRRQGYAMTGLEAGLLLCGTLSWIVWEALRRPRPRRWDWPWAPGAVEVTPARRCSPTEWNTIREKLSRLGTALRAIGESPATLSVFVEHSGDLETALDGVTGVQDLATELSTEPVAIVICRLGAEPGSYHPAVLATKTRVLEALADAHETVPAAVRGRVLVYGGQLPVRSRSEEIHGLLYLHLLTAPAPATDTILDLWRWTLQVGIPATAPRSGVLPPHVRIPAGKNVAREVLTNLSARTRTHDTVNDHTVIRFMGRSRNDDEMVPVDTAGPRPKPFGTLHPRPLSLPVTAPNIADNCHFGEGI